MNKLTTKIKSRQANISDVNELVKLFDEYRIFYGKSSKKENAQDFLSERINKNESKIFIAESNENRIIGFAQLYPLFSSINMNRRWLLNDLFVYEEYRGIGVSKILVDCAKNLCRQYPNCELFLETQKDNKIANNLYNKTGFNLNTEYNCYFWSDS